MDSRGQLDGHLDAWLAVDAASGHRAALMQLTGVLSLPLGALAMWPGWFSDIGARTVLTLWGFSVVGTAWAGFVEWRTLRTAREKPLPAPAGRGRPQAG